MRSESALLTTGPDAQNHRRVERESVHLSTNSMLLLTTTVKGPRAGI